MDWSLDHRSSPGVAPGLSPSLRTYRRPPCPGDVRVPVPRQPPAISHSDEKRSVLWEPRWQFNDADSAYIGQSLNTRASRTTCPFQRPRECGVRPLATTSEEDCLFVLNPSAWTVQTWARQYQPHRQLPMPISCTSLPSIISQWRFLQ